MGRHKIVRLLEEVMAQTDCLSLAQRDYRALSGGEQQRVQLARVLAQLWQHNRHHAGCFLMNQHRR